MATILRVIAGESVYVKFCTVLTAYAESDFRSDAVQKDTVGVFQQNPKWWPSATQGTEAQCRAFIAAFKAEYKRHTGDPVHDCWLVQRWDIPGSAWPDPGPKFESEKKRENSETWNYARRLPSIPGLIGRGYGIDYGKTYGG